MVKLHFRPYIPNQTVLFPGRIDENIAANDPVRIVNTVVDNFNLDNFSKTVEKNRTKLMDKIRFLLEQVDEVIAQENSMKDTAVEFTPAMLSDIVNELKEVLEHQPVTKDKEQKKVIWKKKKQVREFEQYRDKLMEYDNHPFFHSFEQRYNRLPTVGVADSGYGSEENYRFMQDNGIEAFVKYNYFHKEQRPRYTPNPFHAESLHYNAREDYYVCPMGQHMNRIGTRRDKTASGYITMAYKRFRHVGEDKVTMDFAFFAIAFNIKKMCTKLLKAGKRRNAHTIFIFIRPRVTQHTTNIKPYYLITEKIVA